MRRVTLVSLLALSLSVHAVLPALARSPRSAFSTPSFDCARAVRPDERAICSNGLLAELDMMITTLYRMLWHYIENYDGAMGVLAQLRDSQRAFLKRRAACGDDIRCIERVQRKRIDALLDDYKRGTTSPILAPVNDTNKGQTARSQHE